MHEKEAKSILTPQNGMNVYRGCTQGCIYCDSRSDCYRYEYDFEDVEIKKNMAQLLEKSLRSKRRRCMIGIGSMSDPYQEIEKSEQLMRSALELIHYYGYGVTIETKSDLILRDLDLLQAIHTKAKVNVIVSLTAREDALAAKLEPGCPATSRRVEVLKKLKAEGISTYVHMAPLIPGINDSVENVQGLLDLCGEAKVDGILYSFLGVTLRKGSRQHFYKKLTEQFPGMLEDFMEQYGEINEIHVPEEKELLGMIKQYCKEHSIVCDQQKLFTYLRAFEDKLSAPQIQFEF